MLAVASLVFYSGSMSPLFEATYVLVIKKRESALLSRFPLLGTLFVVVGCRFTQRATSLWCHLSLCCLQRLLVGLRSALRLECGRHHYPSLSCLYCRGFLLRVRFSRPCLFLLCPGFFKRPPSRLRKEQKPQHTARRMQRVCLTRGNDVNGCDLLLFYFFYLGEGI